jgi:hypothetical protein
LLKSPAGNRVNGPEPNTLGSAVRDRRRLHPGVRIIMVSVDQNVAIRHLTSTF